MPGVGVDEYLNMDRQEETEKQKTNEDRQCAFACVCVCADCREGGTHSDVHQVLQIRPVRPHENLLALHPVTSQLLFSLSHKHNLCVCMCVCVCVCVLNEILRRTFFRRQTASRR
jgi:hypothetical protein